MFDALFYYIPKQLDILVLIVGFVLLVKGADYFVEGSAAAAKRYHVPPIIIGLTIVAMGTSLPETAVSSTASLASNNELAISNAVGSNIFNLMVVIGICATMIPVSVGIDTLKRDIPFSAICALLLLGLGFFGMGSNEMAIGRADGLILLTLFAVYIIVLIQLAYKSQRAGEKVDIEGLDDIESSKLLSLKRSLAYIIGGCIAIAVGGDLTVNSATRIAISLGMTQTLVGLTIVSVGTSLPELVTSFMAARKHEEDIALGNAIGSNVFNILFVLGIASTLNPIHVINENLIDIVILLGFTAIVWVMAFTKRVISKREGIVMLILYAGYFAYIVVR